MNEPRMPKTAVTSSCVLGCRVHKQEPLLKFHTLTSPSSAPVCGREITCACVCVCVCVCVRCITTGLQAECSILAAEERHYEFSMSLTGMRCSSPSPCASLSTYTNSMAQHVTQACQCIIKPPKFTSNTLNTEQAMSSVL